MLLGSLYMKKGQLKSAVAELEQARQLEPEDIEVAELLQEAKSGLR
jgi:cytochrome c-type biogenesis protein CcmH/NrfG